MASPLNLNLNIYGSVRLCIVYSCICLFWSHHEKTCIFTNWERILNPYLYKTNVLDGLLYINDHKWKVTQIYQWCLHIVGGVNKETEKVNKCKCKSVALILPVCNVLRRFLTVIWTWNSMSSRRICENAFFMWCWFYTSFKEQTKKHKD